MKKKLGIAITFFFAIVAIVAAVWLKMYGLLIAAGILVIAGIILIFTGKRKNKNKQEAANYIINIKNIANTIQKQFSSAKTEIYISCENLARQMIKFIENEQTRVEFNNAVIFDIVIYEFVVLSDSIAYYLKNEECGKFFTLSFKSVLLDIFEAEYNIKNIASFLDNRLTTYKNFDIETRFYNYADTIMVFLKKDLTEFSKKSIFHSQKEKGLKVETDFEMLHFELNEVINL